MRRWLVVAVALVAFGAFNAWRHREVAQGPGVLAGDAPRQTAPADAKPLRHGDFELEPLADFSLEARVLSRHDYHLDTESALAPTDLALGWGRMSDSTVLAALEISQSGRFYFYRWRDAPPIPPAEIVRSSANMHLIPADAGVAQALSRVRTGEVIALSGELVEARRADGWRWRSSLTREDTGAGACELVLVESIGPADAGAATAATAP
jgi:hypothetical protein